VALCHIAVVVGLLFVCCLSGCYEGCEIQNGQIGNCASACAANGGRMLRYGYKSGCVCAPPSGRDAGADGAR